MSESPDNEIIDQGVILRTISSEASKRRVSLFDTKESDSNSEEENVDDLLQEWDRRFGRYHVKMKEIVYPDDYVQKLHTERESCISSLRRMITMCQEVVQKSKSKEIIEYCELSMERVERFQDIDSKIDQYLEEADKKLKQLEISTAMHHQKVEAQERDVQLVDMLISAKIKNRI
ncbi:uncharacterized protein [Euwallacea similis]|uniref:uncharacterized protein n=1 Tax=Euwallacea similis TaxID=1736056 RepID=UPI00344DA61F